MDKENSGGNHWHIGDEAISYSCRVFSNFVPKKTNFMNKILVNLRYQFAKSG
jgi:hypothetical protein